MPFQRRILAIYIQQKQKEGCEKTQSVFFTSPLQSNKLLSTPPVIHIPCVLLRENSRFHGLSIQIYSHKSGSGNKTGLPIITFVGKLYSIILFIFIISHCISKVNIYSIIFPRQFDSCIYQKVRETRINSTFSLSNNLF